jgi:transposase
LNSIATHNQIDSEPTLTRSHLINGISESHCITTDLTDEQWSIISPLIADPPRRPDGKGRPWKDARDIMNGVLLWILLRTGATLYDMPDRYPPPYQTCHHRRFQQWVRTGGVFEKILQALATTDLRERWELDLSNVIDGTFTVAKKRGGERDWKRDQAEGQRYEAHGNIRQC